MNRPGTGGETGTSRIAVLPCDGIGQEVMCAGVEVLRAVESRLETVRFETYAIQRRG
jgi:isocitrate/isopropylmalate dehydrogenase